MRGSRRDYHQSSFTFESFQEPLNDPQKDKIYSYPTSQITEAMQAAPHPLPTRTQLYQHQIFHSTHKYEVPLDPAAKPTNNVPPYQQFYKTFRKFTKPYGELTKYTDSLKQNQALLRRAQYDTPIDFNHPCLSQHVFRSTRPFQGHKVIRKEGRSLTRAVEEKEEHPFHKTIHNHFVAFHKLMGKERQSKDDMTQLNNSLNRLLAAQSIREQLKGRGRLRSKTQNR